MDTSKHQRESGQAPGDDGLPTGALPEQGGQLTSTGATSTPAGLSRAEVLALVEEAVGRSNQSTKDKRIHQLEQKADDFESRLARYEDLRKTMSPTQARQQLDIEETVEYVKRQKSGDVPAMSQVGNQAAGAAGEDVLALLKDAGLEQDPEALQLMRDGRLSSMMDAASFSVRRLKGLPPPNVAIVTQPGGGAPNTLPDVESLTKRLQALIQDPRKNAAEITKVKEEIRKQLAS